MSSNLIDFLTSKEIILIYIIAGGLIVLGIIIYLVKKYNYKIRQRHNTRELNKIVEEITSTTDVEEELSYDEPIMIETIPINDSISEMLVSANNTDNDINSSNDIKSINNDNSNITSIEVNENNNNILIEQNEVIDDTINNSINQLLSDDIDISYETSDKTEYDYSNLERLDTEVINNNEEEIEYTTIEPDMATAKLELERITEELKRQEENNNIINLTNFEEEQEENAIISLDELLKKGKKLYESNETTQYMDEGNEPISIQELEKRTLQMSFDTTNSTEKNEAVIIDNIEVNDSASDVNKENNTSKVVEYNKDVRFQSSPVISPVYGIEKMDSINYENDLELENTANYEKLDAEIKKTNEFLMTLKELQKKLD